MEFHYGDNNKKKKIQIIKMYIGHVLVFPLCFVSVCVRDSSSSSSSFVLC